MVAVAAALLTMLAWGPETGTLTVYLFVFAVAVAVAFAKGMVIGPATEAVMSAVPEGRAGVGSAMNDVTRVVAGALGVAVIVPPDPAGWIRFIDGLFAEHRRHPELVEAFREAVLMPRRNGALKVIERGPRARGRDLVVGGRALISPARRAV